jgi:hypothetical protein
VSALALAYTGRCLSFDNAVQRFVEQTLRAAPT